MSGVLLLGSASLSPNLGAGGRDKGWHALAFGLMQALNLPAVMTLWGRASRRQAILVAWCVSVGVGGALEWWQSHLSYRTAEWADAGANALGAILVAGWQWAQREARRP